MRLFFKFCDINWQATFAYRTESLLWFVIETIPILIMTSLWKSLELSGHISVTQAKDLILYYILTLFIARLAACHFEEWFSEDIKDGRINSSLLKPFPIKTYLFAHSIVHRLLGTVYTVPVFIFLWPLYSSLFINNFSALKLALFALLVLIGFLQKFLVSWLISVTAFWLDQTYFLSHMKWLMEGLFGGGWLPVTFFPLWWQEISKYTPFYYWFFFPIRVYTATVPMQEIITGLSMSIIWLILLWLLSQTLWRAGVKKHSAVSG